MESGDGGWIRAECDGESQGEEPGLREDDGWPAPVAEPSAASSARSSAGERWGHRGASGFSAWVAAAVAVLAAAAGVAVGLSIIGSTPTAGAIAWTAPSASASPEQLRIAGCSARPASAPACAAWMWAADRVR
jgi:hypothetical protein